MISRHIPSPGILSDKWPGSKIIIIIIGFLGEGDFTWWGASLFKKSFDQFMESLAEDSSMVI